ncbi:uncharacterized protein LOC142169075 [Nicotiana tabacum]|uniref:Uncharacterized protein LOC142169075 n=1 Tax=Nicotiana tabacum TaxID=4097 RepID=A0AC58SN32_TOBAC
MYKLVTKIIVNRIKYVLNNIIGPTQASFLSNRRAANNAIVVHEYINHFQKMKGKNANMILKVDLEKAFDRIEWSFIKDSCSSSIFQRLSRNIKEAVRNNSWFLISINRSGHMISHLFFADDLTLFARANNKNYHAILRALGEFNNASGQKDLNSISYLVPHEISTIIQRTSIPLNAKANDKLIRKLIPTGIFSCRPAYNFIAFNFTGNPDQEDLYDWIWKLKVPNKIKFFTWMMH